MSIEDGNWRGQPCAYCGVRPSVSRDHVIPKAVRRRYVCRWMVRTGECPCPVKHRAVAPKLLGLVPCCLTCNVNKSTRKLVPPSWADRIPALKEAIPGHWRVWDGNTKSPAFHEAYF